MKTLRIIARQTLSVMASLGIVLLALGGLSGCAQPRSATIPSQRLTIPAHLQTASTGRQIPNANTDSVVGTLIISQSAQLHWFQYDDAFACVVWTRDSFGDDLLRFEETPCVSGKASIIPRTVAFTLTFESAPSGVSGQFLLLDNRGDAVGKAHLDTGTGIFYLDELCELDFAATCAIGFDNRGSFSKIQNQLGVSLSF